ncbi:MAG TPA: VWA domain-containing protein [Terriglobales bacterium]|nr:VWA domain-containing protein [Terriglobales bacterium]
MKKYSVRLRRGVLVAAMISVMGWIPARSQSQSEVPAPTIRVSTHLVLVDVVVTDRQGKPITGLKPEDFTVQEKGKNQKIAFFSTPEDMQKVASPPELGPGIYSNKPEFRFTGKPVTILLLDAVNTAFRDQAYARQQMLKYVREQMKPGERMGVFALTDSLRALQDFTSDPQVLMTALEHYKPEEQKLGPAAARQVSTVVGSTDYSPGLTSQLEFAQSEITSFQSAQVSFQFDRQFEITLGAMRGLSRILAGIPGRKNVVWLTATFPFELIPEDRNVSGAELLASLPNIQQKGVGTIAAGSLAASQRSSHADEIRVVSSQLAASQIAIYPVDVRGLISGMEFLSSDSANRQVSNTSEIAVARATDTSASHDTMRAIANETGGRAYVNQNDVRQGVALAVADNSSSYTIGYYPDDKKMDGKYRQIKVKVNKDAVEVRHRQGYFAIDPTQVKDKKADLQVAEALRDMVPDTQVIFSAQVKKSDKGTGIDMLIDPRTVSAADASGGKKLNLAVYAAVYSHDGKMIQSASQKVDQTFKDDIYQQILQKGILLHLDVDKTPANDDLRIAVQDVRTGLVGTLTAKTP